MRRSSSLLLFLLALGLPLTAAAELPAWLRTENGDVAEGNQKLNKGDAKGALAAFDQAARRLPGSPGVQLDRGLSLLKLGEFAKAREALLAATEPSAGNDLRADAYENLALGFYREADGLAAQNKHEEAQRLFREAVDAAKRSLRLRPSDRNTAWNLELAARRVREEEKKEQDDKQKQDQKDKDKDKDKQDDKSQDKDQKQDQKPDDQKQQDQKQSDQDKKNDQQKKQDEQKKAQDQDKQKQEQKPQADKKEAEKQAKAAEQNKAEEAAKKKLPPEAEQALDALQNSEENFERVQAKRRAAQERRAPEKDW